MLVSAKPILNDFNLANSFIVTLKLALNIAVNLPKLALGTREC